MGDSLEIQLICINRISDLCELFSLMQLFMNFYEISSKLDAIWMQSTLIIRRPLHIAKLSLPTAQRLSSTIFTCLSFVHLLYLCLVTPPLISTISCFRPCKPYIFCEDMILAMCHRHQIPQNHQNLQIRQYHQSH